MATHKLKQRVGNRRNWVVRFMLIAFALFVFLKVVQLSDQLQEKRKQIADRDRMIQTQLVINEGLADQVTNADDYREQGAYENGYVHSGQQIYQSEEG